MKQPPKNHIEEYFSKTEKGVGNELFRVDDTNSDLKSELTEEEIRQINTLMMNDGLLDSTGIGEIYKEYYKSFLRLKVSLMRKGRTEFVEINRHGENPDATLGRLANFSRGIGNNGVTK